MIMLLRIGVLSPSNVAIRRFMPSLMKCEGVAFSGVAIAGEDEWTGVDSEERRGASRHKADEFIRDYGGTLYCSYCQMIESDDIDAVYLPLPPALHFSWGKRVLEAGKHLLMEKPFTTSLQDTQCLLRIAEEKRLAVHENYMFVYHKQLKTIREIVGNGTLGAIRLFRMSFGFPNRGADDFRYHRDMGGGALLDCGGYPVRLALELLRTNARIVQAKLVQPEGYEVDLFGSVVMENDEGQCAQLSFGMDNAYQCQLEIWGSDATLIASRIFTAGADDPPNCTIRDSKDSRTFKLDADDQFLHSIEAFRDKTLAWKPQRNQDIACQARLIHEIQEWRT